MSEKHKKVISFTKKQMDMLSEMAEYFGITSLSEVVRLSIRLVYDCKETVRMEVKKKDQ